MSAEGGPHICYFVRICPKCGRFVKVDKEVNFRGDGQPVGANATCRVHGRVVVSVTLALYHRSGEATFKQVPIP